MRIAMIGIAAGGWIASGAMAGPLTPPAGPIASTPGPEPRIAINSTNTPGDVDSIYKISAPGSYYLTGNLAGIAAKSGIEIASSGVTVDLMGFELLGVAGSLDGVTTTASGFSSIEVRNGSVRTWGGDGVDVSPGLNSNCRVTSITSVGNAQNGIRTNSGCVIEDCIASENTLAGIFTGPYCTISRCLAKDNDSLGINCNVAVNISDCVAAQNANSGIGCNSGSTITHCTAYSNGIYGISVNAGSAVTGCTARNNAAQGIYASSSGNTITGCTATSNQFDGIRVIADCVITDNTCVGNGVTDIEGSGILITGTGNRIEGNTCNNNRHGIRVAGSDNVISRNTCSDNSVTNWELVAGNVAVIFNATKTAAAVSGDAGGLSPGSTNPNANYTY